MGLWDRNHLNNVALCRIMSTWGPNLQRGALRVCDSKGPAAAWHRRRGGESTHLAQPGTEPFVSENAPRNIWCDTASAILNHTLLWRCSTGTVCVRVCVWIGAANEGEWIAIGAHGCCLTEAHLTFSWQECAVKISLSLSLFLFFFSLWVCETRFAHLCELSTACTAA